MDSFTSCRKASINLSPVLSNWVFTLFASIGVGYRVLFLQGKFVQRFLALCSLASSFFVHAGNRGYIEKYRICYGFLATFAAAVEKVARIPSEKGKC